MSQNNAVLARSSGAPYQVSLEDGRHHWQGDTVAGNGGGDVGPDPEAQLLGALGACTAITLRMFAARRQWPLRAVEVELRYDRRDASGTAIERSIRLLGELDQEQRQTLLEIAGKCPLHRLLTGPVEIASTLAE